MIAAADEGCALVSGDEGDFLLDVDHVHQQPLGVTLMLLLNY